VNPYEKGPQLLAANPRGLVPTLEVAPGKSLYESNVLNEYLEDHYPSHLPHLLPPVGTDDFRRAKSRIWIDFVTSRVIPAFHRLLQCQPKDVGEQRLEELRVEFKDKLLEWAREALKNDESNDEAGPYFFGGKVSLVDIALTPWAVSFPFSSFYRMSLTHHLQCAPRLSPSYSFYQHSTSLRVRLTQYQTRLWVFDTFKGGLHIPPPGEGGADEKAWARWRSWLDAVTSRESVKRTMSDREHFLPIYKKYADDIAQSELAKATRSGRGVP
jgi:glutathione S-transferase